jgi:hypothetical protein
MYNTVISRSAMTAGKNAEIHVCAAGGNYSEEDHCSSE